MRWKIGECEYDSITRAISPVSAPPLGEFDAKLLELLIDRYGAKNRNAQLKREVWGKEDSDDSLYKSVERLREAFGEERSSYILSRPVRLAVKPELIADDKSVHEQGIPFDFHGPTASEPLNEPSLASTSDFTLIVDGMIINSVGELLFEDRETKPIQSRCAASYKRSLEDLAFAVVYATRLVTTKDFRPSLTKPDQQGQVVAARLSEICEQRKYPSHIGDGRLLQKEETRNSIKEDIERFAKLVEHRQYEHYFRDYMLREGTKHLGESVTLFQEDFDPGKYEYHVGRPYYQYRELQDALGDATPILAGYLPEHPPSGTDPYAQNALKEFASRNVLSLLTIMWEGYEVAKIQGSAKMPHVLRALVGSDRITDQGGTQSQGLLRDFAVEHALITVLKNRRADNRDNMLASLLDIRDDFPFKQIREVLDRYHLIHIEPGKEREVAARHVHKELKRLVATPYVQPDKVQFMDLSAIRAVDGMRSRLYEEELYRVFPELTPARG